MAAALDEVVAGETDVSEQDAFAAVERDYAPIITTIPHDDLVSSRVLAGSLVYLATPFSKRAVDDGAFSWNLAAGAAHDARVWQGWLAAHGVTAISPISAAYEGLLGNSGGVGCYAIPGGFGALRSDQPDPLDAVFWEAWCKPLLEASDCVVIPPIEGWRDSAGIAAEVAAADEHGLPVYCLTHECV